MKRVAPLDASGNSHNAAWVECLAAPVLLQANKGPFDSTRISLREVLAPLKACPEPAEGMTLR